MAERTPARKTEIARLIERIEQSYPKASLMYARIVIALLDAPDRTLAASDLSEAIGKGRDSSGVQTAIARLDEAGLVKRELVPADGMGGNRYLVQLLR